jgi:hypothetical protein
VKASSVAFLPTPPKNDSDPHCSNNRKRDISIRELTRILGFSNGTGWHTMTIAESKRGEIANEGANGWIMLDEDDERTKYLDNLLDSLELWMVNNDMVLDNPCKGELVIKRDRQGDIVRDATNNEPIRIPKMMLLCNPRMLHNHMIETFGRALDGDKVIVSESKRQLLKTSCSYIKKMTACQKMMCGCETCIIFDDIQHCLNLFRKKYIGSLIAEVQQLRNGQAKALASEKLSEYIEQICADPSGEIPKYTTGWDAASAFGCACIKIGGRSYAPMSCVLNTCPNCDNRWKDQMVAKMELDCKEKISYVIFGTHSKCSYHGDGNMDVKGKEYICRECNSMALEKLCSLKGGPPKVKKVKLRIMLTEAMDDFVSPGGTYKNYLLKMYHHVAHVRLPGSWFATKMVYDYCNSKDDVLVMEMDYLERYQPMPMREIESENFRKDADVSMEIRIVTYTGKFDGPNSGRTQKVISYAHLSDEKSQIAATTFVNTVQMLDDIHERGELEGEDYNTIIQITDGCAGQSKCGTALYN